MDINNLKHVVAAQENEPAIIRFFDSVNEYSARCFNEEFLWVQNCVKPSKIIVLINSEGGSVLYGMSMFSVIQSCPIEVDCVVEGIAASMGSVIWAAGDNLYMHDYSLVMIHNPFVGHMEDESTKAMVEAFRTQLATIYCKRFGLSKEDVSNIMDGEGKAEATWFDAKSAVKAGIIGKGNVIKTTKAIRDSVQNRLVGIEDAASIKEVMASISQDIDENKLVESVLAIHKQNTKEIQAQNVMENTNLFGTVAAQLGFSADAEVTTVSARIADLLKNENEINDAKAKLQELEDVKARFEDLKIQFAGKEAEVTNANAELDKVKAELKAYQDAEAAALEAEIEATVQAAVDAGKIDESAKSQWIAMAQNNFDMVKATLASISAREKITEQIANDPANVQAAAEATKDAEKRMNEKVTEVVGAEFELKTF